MPAGTGGAAGVPAVPPGTLTRLRNTQYVQPWYSSTNGRKMHATTVISASVFAVDEALPTVSV